MSYIFYLIAELSSVLSYTLGQLFVKKGFIEISMKQIILIYLHIDLILFFLYNLYIIFYQKLYKKRNLNLIEVFNKKENLKQFFWFLLPVFSSVYKAFLIAFLAVSNIETSKALVPIVVSLLIGLFPIMKLQKEKITKIHVLLSICALFGFLIINFGKFNFNKISDFYFILSFVLIKSFGNFTRRVFCIKRNNTIQATWAEMLIYFIYGFLILFSGEFLFYDFFYKIFKCKIEFSMYLLTNPFVWLISLLCLSHHCFIIPAVRNAKHLIKIELLSFSNIVFSILIDFLFFGLFSLETIIGGGIITASLIVFNWKREKKEDTITLK